MATADGMLTTKEYVGAVGKSKISKGLIKKAGDRVR